MSRGSVRLSLLLLGLPILLAFTIVRNPDPSEAKSANLSDAERMQIFVNENWDDKFVPFFAEAVHPFTDVSSALKEGLEPAGVKFGLRPEGESNPWNFVVSGEGTIVAANTESRAATASVDMDGDGDGDITLQLGPVIKGTTLRDAATFLKFSDFRDQIEYAKLARALNTKVHERLAEALLPASIQGKIVSFSGAFTMRSPSDDLLVTPIEVRLNQ